MLVYRLASARYPANDGMGARLYGGRWNHKGTPVIYAAASRALCALEILANANELPSDYVVTDDLKMVVCTAESLPAGWDRTVPGQRTKDLGTRWAAALESLILVTPSAIVAAEQHYLLNPLHPDFHWVVFHPPEPFRFDPRFQRLFKM